MLKNALIVMLFMSCAAFAFSRENVRVRPVLGILLFTGGEGREGDTIASLVSNRREFREEVFTVVPRTLALDAIFTEQTFQLSDLTDDNTVASITPYAQCRLCSFRQYTTAGGQEPFNSHNHQCRDI